MQLDLRGHPLHTRALEVTLTQRADGKLDAHGSLLDLRKHGFVPVGGDLAAAGILHHMKLDGVIDPVTATVESIAARLPTVAFEPSALTGGESCRDPSEGLAALAGVPLGASYPKRLTAEIGGPRGCSHVLTLAQLVGASAAWALGNGKVCRSDAAWLPEQRLFRRVVVVDGNRLSQGSLALATQLTDLHFAPAAAVARPMDRFAGQMEVRLLAEVDLKTLTFSRITAAERRRGPADLTDAVWRDRTARTVQLSGLSLFRGISAELVGRLGDEPADQPLLDALLMVAPAFIQVCALVSDEWPVRVQSTDSVLGIAGLPDSCYMWRRAGALDKARKPSDPDGTW